MINHADSHKRENLLNHVVPYMLKADQSIDDLRENGRERAITKGITPKPKTALEGHGLAIDHATEQSHSGSTKASMRGPIRKCNLPASLIKQIAFSAESAKKKRVQQRDVQHCFVADASGERSVLCALPATARFKVLV